MRLVSFVPGIALALAACGEASAQVTPDLVRFEAVTGFVLQGDLASAEFFADYTPFGGPLVHRTDGALDVDPAIWFGLRTSYRLTNRIGLSASWMHTVARFRIRFPALASDPGDFDLEGLLLGTLDFMQQAGTSSRAERAMGDAVTDVYLLAGRVEFPALRRWLFPYVTLGGGILQQKSRGDVIQFEYDGPLPPFAEQARSQGLNEASFFGVSVFSIDETDPVLSIGGGLRISLSKKWGVDVSFEDFVRLGADLSEIDEASTPPPNPEQDFRVFSTSFQGKKGAIHNYALRLSVDYALWPKGLPR
jgi:hypothetical protein